MKNQNSLIKDELFGGIVMARTLSELAKSKGKMEIHFPLEIEHSAYRGWIFENDDPNSTFNFWYAGFMLLDPNTNESWLTVSFIPNQLGGVDIVRTEVKSKEIRELKIVEKIESSGFSFGFFSIEKLEIKHHFSDWRSRVTKIKATSIIRLDSFGNKVVGPEPSVIPDLPIGNLENPTRGLLTSRASTAGHIYNQVTCEDLAKHDALYYPKIEEERSSNGELLDVALHTAPEVIEQSANMPVHKKPGLYIKTGGQAGIPALNMMEIYMVNADGHRKMISRNICMQVTYDEYKKRIIKKSGSGPFGKSSIKIIIKGYSKSLTSCGEVGFSPEPLTRDEPLEVKTKKKK